MRNCRTSFAFCLSILFTSSCQDSSGPEQTDVDADLGVHVDADVEVHLPGLEAIYSTGFETIESVVFHGWWNECADTDNNMYLGECTAVEESPVDWARADFSASWQGYLYVPESGDYRFNSHYWVDGTVFISINDTTVADFDTTGGGYSNTMTLSGETWYPVSMTFAANGGSNNMHLGWTKPGAEWEIVPAENLGH